MSYTQCMLKEKTFCQKGKNIPTVVSQILLILFLNFSIFHFNTKLFEFVSSQRWGCTYVISKPWRIGVVVVGKKTDLLRVEYTCILNGSVIYGLTEFVNYRCKSIFKLPITSTLLSSQNKRNLCYGPIQVTSVLRNFYCNF